VAANSPAAALELMAEMTYEPWSGKWRRIAEQSTGRDVLFARA